MTSLSDRSVFIQNRLNKAIQKATDQDQLGKIELKFRKLNEKYNLQMKQRKIMYDKISLHRMHTEADMTEKIEKFIYNFNDMTRKFEEQLLVDTRKVRMKDRVHRFYKNRYCKFWDKGRLDKLAIPRRTVKKYTELIGVTDNNE